MTAQFSHPKFRYDDVTDLPDLIAILTKEYRMDINNVRVGLESV